MSSFTVEVALNEDAKEQERHRYIKLFLASLPVHSVEIATITADILFAINKKQWSKVSALSVQVGLLADALDGAVPEGESEEEVVVAIKNFLHLVKR